jgi:hypothetical protein
MVFFNATAKLINRILEFNKSGVVDTEKDFLLHKFPYSFDKI